MAQNNTESRGVRCSGIAVNQCPVETRDGRKFRRNAFASDLDVATEQRSLSAQLQAHSPSHAHHTLKARNSQAGMGSRSEAGGTEREAGRTGRGCFMSQWF